MTPTPEQQLAIESYRELTFCIAGPGAGKTSTLINRILHLVGKCQNCGGCGYTVTWTQPPEQEQCQSCFGQEPVNPNEVVAVTFTNQAANEIAKRLAKFDIKIAFTGTLHSFLLMLIRQHGVLIGYTGNVTVLDEEEACAFLQDISTEHGYRGTLVKLKAEIDKGPIPIPGTMTRESVVASAYWLAMKKQRLLTFDGILVMGERLLKAIDWSKGLPYKHFLVDEVQDSSALDFEIYKQLPGKHWMTGDPDQSVYRWRGARVELCLALAKLDSCNVVPLEKNFRCGQAICNAAQSLIEHNMTRYAKKTVSAVDYPGEILYRDFELPAQEASYIAQTIGSVSDHKECAVLVRTNDLVEEYADHLRAMSIPIAQSRPPERPADWHHTRILLAFLQNPECNYTAYLAAFAILGRERAYMLKVEALNKFTTINQVWERMPVVTLPGLTKALAYLGISSASLEVVLTAVTDLPDTATIADIILELGRGDERIHGEGVTVCTIHAAKGREFDNVFLPAFEQHVIPSERKSLDIEEERRLAYVAITRARRYLVISHCRKRALKWSTSPFPVEVRPSQFIWEMQKVKTAL